MMITLGHRVSSVVHVIFWCLQESPSRYMTHDLSLVLPSEWRYKLSITMTWAEVLLFFLTQPRVPRHHLHHLPHTIIKSIGSVHIRSEESENCIKLSAQRTSRCILKTSTIVLSSNYFQNTRWSNIKVGVGFFQNYF